MKARPYSAQRFPKGMDEQTVSSTSPFYTLDAFDGALAIEVMLAVEAAVQGDEAPWAQLVEEHEGLRSRLLGQGIATPEVWSSIEWDSAMLLFTTCVELAPDGRPLPVGETMTKERFGRFPHGNGSALDYLLEYIRPNRSITEHDGQSIYDALIDLLNKLHSGCREAHRGHTMFEQGFGGMSICGYLASEEVQQLRKHLAGRVWTASYEEPLDGGVGDVAKHLSTLLKAAERRRVGLALRSHR